MLGSHFRVGPILRLCACVALIAAGPAYSGDIPAKPVPEPTVVPSLVSAVAAKQALIGIAAAGSRLVAVGQQGHALYSDDSGRTWTQAKVPVSVDLVAVQFPTPRIGWAVGHDGVVLRSGDAGASWSLVLDGRRAARLLVDFYTAQKWQDDPGIKAALEESNRFATEQGARPFLDVWFSDEKTGFVIGAWGLVLRTADGGATWEPWLHRVDNPKFGHLYSIRPASKSVWIAGEQGLLLRLDDAGRSFISARAPAVGSLFGLVGVPGGVLAYGLVGRALLSRDEGRNWAVSTGLGNSGLTGGTMLPDGSIVLVDVGAGPWVSRDQGQSFVPLRALEPMPYAGVAAVAGRLVLVGLHGVRHQAIAP